MGQSSGVLLKRLHAAFNLEASFDRGFAVYVYNYVIITVEVP